MWCSPAVRVAVIGPACCGATVADLVVCFLFCSSLGNKLPASDTLACPNHLHLTSAATAFHRSLRPPTPAGSVGSAGFPLLPASNHPGEQQQQQQECEAFLTFVGVVGSLVLPVALLVATEPTFSLADWEEKRRQPATAPAAAAGPAAASLRGAVKRLWMAASGVSTAVEGALRQLCGRSWLAPAEDDLLGDYGAAEGGAAAAVGHAPQLWSGLRLDGWTRGLAWWLLLSFLWGASVATAA